MKPGLPDVPPGSHHSALVWKRDEGDDGPSDSGAQSAAQMIPKVTSILRATETRSLQSPTFTWRQTPCLSRDGEAERLHHELILHEPAPCSILSRLARTGWDCAEGQLKPFSASAWSAAIPD